MLTFHLDTFALHMAQFCEDTLSASCEDDVDIVSFAVSVGRGVLCWYTMNLCEDLQDDERDRNDEWKDWHMDDQRWRAKMKLNGTVNAGECQVVKECVRHVNTFPLLILVSMMRAFISPVRSFFKSAVMNFGPDAGENPFAGVKNLITERD